MAAGLIDLAANATKTLDQRSTEPPFLADDVAAVAPRSRPQPPSAPKRGPAQASLEPPPLVLPGPPAVYQALRQQQQSSPRSATEVLKRSPCTSVDAMLKQHSPRTSDTTSFGISEALVEHFDDSDEPFDDGVFKKMSHDDEAAFDPFDYDTGHCAEFHMVFDPSEKEHLTLADLSEAAGYTGPTRRRLNSEGGTSSCRFRASGGTTQISLGASPWLLSALESLKVEFQSQSHSQMQRQLTL